MPRYTTLQWFAPELARLGLLRNEPWVKGAAAEADKMFKGNAQASLRTAAVLLAALHPYAIDYLRQAPVIALALCKGGDMSNARLRQNTAEQLAPMFRKGLRLRELMESVGVAYPLRRLRACNFSAYRDHHTVMRLSHCLPPLMLAECVADGDPVAQSFWLFGLAHWTAQLPSRYHHDDVLFRWAAQALPRRISKLLEDGGDLTLRSDITTVVDFIAAQRATFNEQWGFSRALEEAERWHREIAVDAGADKLCRSCLPHVIDYAPLPHRFNANPYQFVALRSGIELFAEGQAMNHCVASYVLEVAAGQSRIYSVLRDGTRVATLQLVPNGPPVNHTIESALQLAAAQRRAATERDWRLAQLVGRGNSDVSQEVFCDIRYALTALSRRHGVRIASMLGWI